MEVYRALTYPERILMFVSMLKRAQSIDDFEKRFNEDVEMFSTFRPVEKQCRIAIKIYRARQTS
jgi:hypothetical protein